MELFQNHTSCPPLVSHEQKATGRGRLCWFSRGTQGCLGRDRNIPRKLRVEPGGAQPFSALSRSWSENMADLASLPWEPCFQPSLLDTCWLCGAPQDGPGELPPSVFLRLPSSVCLWEDAFICLES